MQQSSTPLLVPGFSLGESSDSSTFSAVSLSLSTAASFMSLLELFGVSTILGVFGVVGRGGLSFFPTDSLLGVAFELWSFFADSEWESLLAELWLVTESVLGDVFISGDFGSATSMFCQWINETYHDYCTSKKVRKLQKRSRVLLNVSI